MQRAYLGVGIQPVTQQLAEQFHVKPREGVVVTEVYPDSPAAKAGLKAGDVIVEFAGVPVANPQELQTAVERAALGKPHLLIVMRDGSASNCGSHPRSSRRSSAPEAGRWSESGKAENSRLEKLGLDIGTLDESVAERLGLKGVEGVVITEVRPDSPAARAGLESGMVITQINRAPVHNLSEATKLLQDGASGEGAPAAGPQPCRFPLRGAPRVTPRPVPGALRPFLHAPLAAQPAAGRVLRWKGLARMIQRVAVVGCHGGVSRAQVAQRRQVQHGGHRRGTRRRRPRAGSRSFAPFHSGAPP